MSQRASSSGRNRARGEPSSGFTLIELLVVVAIIGILAALLLTALSNGKIQAQQTACLNNIRQVTTAGVLYLNDTQGGFPFNDPTVFNYVPGIPPMWNYALTNYGATDQVRLCPSTRPQSLTLIDVAGTADLAWVSGRGSEGAQIGSYGGNGWFTEFISIGPTALDYNGYPEFFFKNLSSVPRPAQTPLFFDQNYIATVPIETDPAATNLYTGQSDPGGALRVGMGCCTILRHGGRTANSSVPYTSGQLLPGAINMSFADGHGQLVKLPNLWNYYWHLNWNPALVKGP